MSHDLIGDNTDAKEALLGPASERRCTATAKHTGGRCGLPPIVGGFVCKWHGGAAPQTIAAARRRMRALVEPAMDRLETLLDSRDETIVARAVQMVLDRAGVGPQTRLEITSKVKSLDGATADDLRRELKEVQDQLPPTWPDHLTPAERVEFESLKRRMDELEASATRRQQGIVEGEVVHAETVNPAEQA